MFTKNISTNVSTTVPMLSNKDIILSKLEQENTELKQQVQNLVSTRETLREIIYRKEDRIRILSTVRLYMWFEGQKDHQIFEYSRIKQAKSKISYHLHDPLGHFAEKCLRYIIVENGQISETYNMS